MTDFRIYPNDDPLFPWSIDSGTKADEARVIDFDFCGISGHTEGPWIVVQRAVLEIYADIAHFIGEDREQ